MGIHGRMESDSFKFTNMENRYDPSVERRSYVHVCFYVGTNSSFYKSTRRFTYRLRVCIDDDGDHNRWYVIPSLEIVHFVVFCSERERPGTLCYVGVPSSICQHVDSSLHTVPRLFYSCRKLHFGHRRLYDYRMLRRFLYARSRNSSIEIRSRLIAGCDPQYLSASS